MAGDDTEQNPGPIIRRGNVNSLTLYEITDYELDVFEKGEPASIYLNFSILFLSLGTAFLIALLTVTIEEIRVFTLFAVATAVGIAGGLVLLIIWLKQRSATGRLCSKIRARVVLDDEPE